MMPQLDPRPIVQVDVEDDANRILEIGAVLKKVAFKSTGRRKQDGLVLVLPEQTLYGLQHSRVVINDQNEVWARQRQPLVLSRNFTPAVQYISNGEIVPWGNSGSTMLIDWFGWLS
jgi:hypothetical protein